MKLTGGGHTGAVCVWIECIEPPLPGYLDSGNRFAQLDIERGWVKSETAGGSQPKAPGASE